MGKEESIDEERNTKADSRSLYMLVCYHFLGQDWLNIDIRLYPENKLIILDSFRWYVSVE